MRLMEEVKQFGKERGKNIEESDLPVKLFFVGPAEAGKTTLLNSLFYSSFSFKSMFAKAKKSLQAMKKTPTGKNYIDEKFSERTIGVEIYSEILEDTKLLIFDMGGQQNYYTLQAIFLDLENSFFLLVVDMTKSKELIEDEIKSQLSLISSKLPKNVTAEAILVGTHTDLLSEREREEKTSMCEAALQTKSYPNLVVEKTLFLNAKEKKTDNTRTLERYCKELASHVKSAMVSILSFI